jgi:hypothetical protein
MDSVTQAHPFDGAMLFRGTSGFVPLICIFAVAPEREVIATQGHCKTLLKRRKGMLDPLRPLHVTKPMQRQWQLLLVQLLPSSVEESTS